MNKLDPLIFSAHDFDRIQKIYSRRYAIRDREVALKQSIKLMDTNQFFWQAQLERLENGYDITEDAKVLLWDVMYEVGMVGV